MKNGLIALALERQIKYCVCVYVCMCVCVCVREREREKTQTLNYLSRFLLHFSHVLVREARLRVQFETSSQGSSTMGTVISGHLHIVVTSVQQSSLHRRVSDPTHTFPGFNLTSTNLTAFPYEFIPTNQSSLPICC